MSATETQTALEQLLGLDVRRVSTAPLLGGAWDMRHNVTLAGAPYLIIARRLDPSTAPVTACPSMIKHKPLHLPWSSVIQGDDRSTSAVGSVFTAQP